LAKRDPHVVFGERDCRCRESRELGQGLAEQQQKDSGDTVSQRFAIAVNKLSQPCQTLLLGERAAGRGLLTASRPKTDIYQGFSAATAPAGWPTVSQDSDSSDENGEALSMTDHCIFIC
jgi:hypothetical protein